MPSGEAPTRLWDAFGALVRRGGARGVLEDQVNVDVLVCTHGSDEWERKGVATMERLTRALTLDGRHHFGDIAAHHNPDGTLAEVRNRAARMSGANWLCFVDAGDHLAVGYFDAVKTALDHHIDGEPQRPHEASRHVPPLLAPSLSFDGGKTHSIPNKGRWPLLNECCIGTVVSARSFKLAGGFREWPSLEDYDLWLRLVGDGAKIVHVPEAVYCAEPPSRDGRNADQSCVVAIRRANARVFDAHH